MDVTITSRIPNIQLDAIPLAVHVHIDDLAEVGDHRSPQLLKLGLALHERLNDASFSDGWVTHENDLRVVNLLLVVGPCHSRGLVVIPAHAYSRGNLVHHSGRSSLLLRKLVFIFL